MEILDASSWLQKLLSRQDPARTAYRAMYSTWWNGLVTDPALMMVPVDDHQVHRGDAVFEAIKFNEKKIYLMTEHLDRLDRSAFAIGLSSPIPRAKFESLLQDVVRVSGLKLGMLRIFLSRGPGSFSTNPYDTVGEQITIIATDLKEISEDKVLKGVSLGISKIPAKDSWQAQIKSCNYLPNVMMKKEAVDTGVDFTVSFGGEFVAEGSTENVVIVTKDGALARPRKAGILAGTMMLRAFELGRSLKLSAYEERDLKLQDLRDAREIMMVGTTLDVLPVSEFDGQRRAVGSVSLALRNLLKADQS